MKKHISRRDFLKLAGGTALVAAGASVLPPFVRKALVPDEVVRAADPAPDLYWAGTDGWIYLPPDPAIPIYFPDDLAPAPFNGYIFGFRNITGLTVDQKLNQKNHAQHNAPMFWANQYDPAHPVDFRVQLTNLGLAGRPDLTDSHTLHWHGFRNVIPFFDGEPTGSISVPVGRDFTYVYRPRDPGTYMYHCHVEDVEHVHMGMTGPVFIRPLQNGNTLLYPSGKYAYNDGDGTTGYDREFVMFMSEFWAEAHWADSHIQLPDWSDYHADYSLLNGRVYPDTLVRNSPINAAQSIHAHAVDRDVNGDLVAPAGHPELQYQPLSSMITCNPGERVLLRFINLGFREAAMTLDGIKMHVIGRDATLLRGRHTNATLVEPRDGADTSYVTNTILCSAGESYDAIFTAPPYNGSSGNGYDTYMIYNRRLTQVSNLSAGGFGGQATEVRVYPGPLAAQQYPNDWGM